MATFAGTPREFLGAVLMGSPRILSASSIGASTTTYTELTEADPQLVKLVCDGNSLSLDYPADLRTLLVGSQASHAAQVYSVLGSGTGSTTTIAMIAAFMAEVHTPHFNPHLVNVVHFNELTNQIAQAGVDGTLEQVIASAIEYCDMARGLGWLVSFHIPTPRVSVTDPGYEASFSAWSNATELGVYEDACEYFRNHSEHYDFLVDLAADPDLADPTDTEFYDTDGVHHTVAGSLAKAACIHTAMLDWF